MFGQCLNMRRITKREKPNTDRRTDTDAQKHRETIGQADTETDR